MAAAARAFLVACVGTVVSLADSAPAQTTICESAGVRVSVDFTGGGRHTCQSTASGEIVLVVAPEGEPINPSPWYAFRLDAERPTRLRVTLDYGQHEHRYAPEYSHDGGRWRPLTERAVAVATDEHQATLSLTLQRGATVIAAQPITTPAAVHDWARETLLDHGFDVVRYGTSIDGQPLIGYVGGTGDDLVVALTLQHPPEITGAFAFRAFVERLTADTPQARAFRTHHRILLAPMPNPDGMTRGHWRWNNGGTDLNRDWHSFTQPETQALRDFILREAAGRRTVAFLDFHSTRSDVIYAPAFDANAETIALLPFLQSRLDRRVNPTLRWHMSHNESTDTSKRWALEALGAPGVTIELSDDASDARTRRVGHAIADAMLEHFTH